MSVHTCHAEGCGTPCKPEFLMCPRHWRMVPRDQQWAVYAAYVPGQCSLDPPPSDAWFAAAFAAIDTVAAKEGRRSVLDKGEPEPEGPSCSPAGDQVVAQPARCPTCRSLERDRQQGLPHADLDSQLRCPDPWHAKEPS